MKKLSTLSIEKKKEIGKELNKLKSLIQEKIESKKLKYRMKIRSDFGFGVDHLISLVV